MKRIFYLFLLLICCAFLSNAQTGVSTYAGKPNSYGFANGKLNEAVFRQPNGVVTDSKGNVYLSDQWHYAIRKMDTDGNVTTYIGGPSSRGDLDGNISTASILVNV